MAWGDSKDVTISNVSSIGRGNTNGGGNGNANGGGNGTGGCNRDAKEVAAQPRDVRNMEDPILQVSAQHSAQTTLSKKAIVMGNDSTVLETNRTSVKAFRLA